MSLKMVKEKKKKHWVKIMAPPELDSEVLGETIIFEPKTLIGRKLDVNLFTLTRDLKKQNSNLGFIIKDIKEGQATTELYKYYISLSYMRRLVKNSKDKIEDSFIAETKDKIKVRIKPVMITKRKTSKSILTNLRMTSRDMLSKYLSETNFTEFVKEIVMGRIQVRLKHNLKKIYPLSLYDIKNAEKLK